MEYISSPVNPTRDDFRSEEGKRQETLRALPARRGAVRRANVEGRRKKKQKWKRGKEIVWRKDIKRGGEEEKRERDFPQWRGGMRGPREKLSARTPMRSGYSGIIFQVLPLCEEFPRKAIFEIFKIHIIMAAKPVLIIK